jgi:hypothetical protein
MKDSLRSNRLSVTRCGSFNRDDAPALCMKQCAEPQANDSGANDHAVALGINATHSGFTSGRTSSCPTFSESMFFMRSLFASKILFAMRESP